MKAEHQIYSLPQQNIPKVNPSNAKAERYLEFLQNQGKPCIPEQHKRVVIQAYAKFLEYRAFFFAQTEQEQQNISELFRAFFNFRKEIEVIIGNKLLDDLFGTEQDVYMLFNHQDHTCPHAQGF